MDEKWAGATYVALFMSFSPQEKSASCAGPIYGVEPLVALGLEAFEGRALPAPPPPQAASEIRAQSDANLFTIPFTGI